MTRRTTSPSSSTTRRSTPCVLGCCGPMLMVTVSGVRGSGGAGLGSISCMPGSGLQRKVFAQGVPLEIVGHQDAPQVGVVLEADADQVEGLALVPVGAAPDGRDAGDLPFFAEARA